MVRTVNELSFRPEPCEAEESPFSQSEKQQISRHTIPRFGMTSVLDYCPRNHGYFIESPDRAEPELSNSSWYFCPANRIALSSLAPDEVLISAESWEAFVSSWTTVAAAVANSLRPWAM